MSDEPCPANDEYVREYWPVRTPLASDHECPACRERWWLMQRLETRPASPNELAAFVLIAWCLHCGEARVSPAGAKFKIGGLEAA